MECALLNSFTVLLTLLKFNRLPNLRYTLYKHWPNRNWTFKSIWRQT